jgi:hypothetical protein
MNPPRHDSVALRYCAATNTGGLLRGCLCTVGFSQPVARQ